ISASLWKGWSGVAVVAVLLALALPGQARAQDNVGGHFGVAFPLFTRAQGRPTSLGTSSLSLFPWGSRSSRARRELRCCSTSNWFLRFSQHRDRSISPSIRGS